MTAPSVAEMLAEWLAPLADVAATPAKPAKAANDEQRRAFPADRAPCEGLRIVANVPADSQAFAEVRNPASEPDSKHWRGNSQDSQHSQGFHPATDATPDGGEWSDRDIARFLARRDRLTRWGWPEADAEALAERLVFRDRGGDDRASCIECARYRPGRCGDPLSAGLLSPEVGRDLAAMLQRCPAFAGGDTQDPDGPIT